MTKLASLREDLAAALSRLEEALARPKDTFVRDAAIQRFEIAFELCWKMLKTFLAQEHNAVCTSPRTCFKAAFKNGIIADDPFWIELTRLRNYTVHTYNEMLAEYVYVRLPEAARRFREALERTAEST
jgi:nucleotidyltransferase substrate binding protein (TIGR01987 family)